MNPLDNILLIANPAAQSGRGGPAAHRAFELFEDGLRGSGQVEFLKTQAPGHAARVVADRGSDFSSIVVLGGDGIIHEVANAMMDESCGCRTLGVIPVGSGNDFARSLGMSEDVATAVSQLLEARIATCDLGWVNGIYFTETLSMGLCAAIALGTVERRKKRGKAGTMLYLEEGIDQLLHHFAYHPFYLEVVSGPDAGELREGDAIIAAIQNGPTYGGGFKICPDASISDGVLDICVASGRLGRLQAVKVFLSAKDGGHVGHRVVEFLRATELKIRFDDTPKCQVDGEALQADEYHIRVVPGALNVFHGGR